jgi:uncharacterized protein (TIGR00297 family)
MIPVVPLFIGLVLSSLIGSIAYRRRSLTQSGVLGAILTGTVIFGLGGFVPGLLLVSFFVSSSILSHYKQGVKQHFVDTYQKDARRDLGQALANGGWGAVLAFGYWFAGWNQIDARIQVSLFAAFVGAMATVTADTWATEIGVLSKSSPRMITTGRIVPTGTSGAVTPLGSFASFVGAAFIGVMGIVGVFLVLLANLSLSLDIVTTIPPIGSMWLIFVVASVSGLAGAVFDSFLGATIQAVYFSEYDERQTEKRIDSQGNPTRRVRGWAWLDNDWVNFIASIFGSVIAALLTLFLI